MTTVTMEKQGSVPIPATVRDRYGLSPEVPIRIVETGAGVLLVPLTGDPPCAELAAELAEWQDLGAKTWASFPYEENE